MCGTNYYTEVESEVRRLAADTLRYPGILF